MRTSGRTGREARESPVGPAAPPRASFDHEAPRGRFRPHGPDPDQLNPYETTPMKRALSIALAGAALASLAQAQSTASSTDLPRLSTGVQQLQGPVQHYELKLATGELTRVDSLDPTGFGQLAVSATAFQNDCTSGSFAGVGTDEFVDWGTKAGGLSELVTSFDFAYATDAADITIGGPGATVDIAIYEGTTGGGVLGTEVARFAFTGLPAVTTTGFAAFIVSVDLSGGFEFCLADGPIGYGYCSNDPGTTGPLITDIPSCPNGQVDAFDSWSCPAPGGTFNGTFFFGGAPTASFYMVLNEDDGSEIATTAPNNGTGINPILLDDGGVPPVLGQAWPATVDTGVGGHSVSSILLYKGSLPAGTLIIGAGEVIVDPFSGQDFTGTVSGTGINDHSVVVPKDISLIGADYTVQALVYVGAPVQLSNAIDINLGF